MTESHSHASADRPAAPSGALDMDDIPTATLAARVRGALDGRSIVLVGMMGAGKSAIGRRLGRAVGLPFVDADTEIEQAAGMSIPDIFEAHGEAYFRAGEARVMTRLLDGEPCVLATGGGAFMNPETRARIAERGVSVWLRADVSLLAKRVRRKNDRPLLMNGDPEATIRSLLDQREPVYGEADVTVESREVPHEQIVHEALAALAQRLASDGGH